MKIQEIDGKCIRISPTSITVLGESGKTAGVVRGIKSAYTLQQQESMRELMDARRALQALTKKGMPGSWHALNKNLYWDGKQLFLVVQRRKLQGAEAVFYGEIGRYMPVIACNF